MFPPESSFLLALVGKKHDRLGLLWVDNAAFRGYLVNYLFLRTINLYYLI
jgi:hypothetical protein